MEVKKVMWAYSLYINSNVKEKNYGPCDKRPDLDDDIMNKESTIS